MTTARLADLESRLGHRFADPALLERALTHSSFSADHNERLEFLGDGVLDCAIAEELFRKYPSLPEGKLTHFRASLVAKRALLEVGRNLALEPLLRIGQSTRANDGIVANAVEAVLGAVFLDAGYEAARKTVLAIFRPLLAKLDPNVSAKDAKTRLQELLHQRGQEPKYSVVGEGPAHQRLFHAECVVPGGLKTTGHGSSHKEAQIQAAEAMLDKLGG